MEKDMDKERYPDPSAKNQVAELIYWFYNRMGMKADSSIYARYSSKSGRSLYPMMINKDKRVQTYRAQDFADLVFYLESQDVIVDRLSILTMPGLMNVFMGMKSNSQLEAQMENTVDWLKKIGPQVENYSKIPGW